MDGRQKTELGQFAQSEGDRNQRRHADHEAAGESSESQENRRLSELHQVKSKDGVRV